MNKDMYIEMLEKRVNELEEFKEDINFLVEQYGTLEEEFEILKQEYEDLKSRNEYVMRVIKAFHDNAMVCSEATENEELKSSLIKEAIAYESVLRCLKSDDDLNEYAKIMRVE